MGIALAKFVGFLITSSSSLLAESIHSVADASNQGLLVLGGRRARRDPTELHPFGFGRVRYFWAFVVAVVLFALGGVFSAYEGYHKIADPHEITSPEVALGILGLAIVFEAFALRTAVRHARPLRGRRSWVCYIRESRSPDLPVLLLEDSGALLGLIFATSGIVLSLVTGNPIFDGIGTLAIGVLLIGIAAVLAVEMKSLHRRSGPTRHAACHRDRTRAGHRSPAGDPRAHPAPRPGRAPRGRQGGVRPVVDDRRAGRGD